MKTVLRTLVASFALASAAHASPIQFADNGHYYEFVSGNYTWADARTAAEGLTFNGLQGYLATITSQAEQDFLYSQVSGALGWIGGSDDGHEGLFKWVTGPEAGQDLVYTNWNGGEPNNYGGAENWIQANWSGSRWNDHNASATNGYFVEYSANVPEPSTSLLLGLGLMGALLAGRRRAK